MRKQACEKIFSSPLGDGLVRIKPFITKTRVLFSSPLGDGLVLRQQETFRLMSESFSSPLGDGLVLQILTEILKNQVMI